MESLKLDHLTENEIANVNGGWWNLIVGALIGAALTQDLDSLAASFKEGYNDAG